MPISEAQRSPLSIDVLLPTQHLLGNGAFVRRAVVVGGGSWKIVLLGVFAHGTVGSETRSQLRHAFPHPRNPCGGNAVVSGIELGNHLALSKS